jgi:hypothetical protein
MSWIETLRGPKILDMSIFDWLISLLGAYLLGRWLKVKMWPLFLLCWILFGIAVHWIMGVPTMLGYYLGLNEKPVRPQHPEENMVHPAS